MIIVTTANLFNEIIILRWSDPKDLTLKTFSHGLMDYVALFANSSKGLWYPWLGPLWALLYFSVFYFSIKTFKLVTLGRE